MKLLRRLHLYLGVFFTPVLLLFLGTGWFQTLNRDRLKSVSEAESLVQKLRVVHTDQIYPSNHEIKRPSSPKAFSALVGVMSGAMIVTALIGLILAFRSVRPGWPIWASLVGGLALPILLLWLGQRG
jgi:hypothetical protein